MLAHARLAIIDLVTGTQPIGNEDGTVQVVLNGEIYNYRELRAELERRGHRFRTQSDTEVIPHLYEEMGERLRVAAARHVRDRAARREAREARCSRATGVGKKPLYWARTPAGLCSSRASLGPCSGAKDVDRRIDPEAVVHYLTWQYVPAPWSIYRGIRKLPAATMLVADARGERLDAVLGRRALAAAAAGRRRGALEARGDPRPRRAGSGCGATCRSARSSPEASTPGIVAALSQQALDRPLARRDGRFRRRPTTRPRSRD